MTPRPGRAGRRPQRAHWWRRGAVASEFVLIVPLFVLILFATVDIVRVFRAQMRVEMVAVQIGQIVSQCPRITQQDFSDTSFGFWAHAGRIAGGLVDVNSVTGGAMIVSTLGRDNDRNRLYWQQRTGNPTPQSVLGIAPAASVTLSGRNGDPFIVPVGQTLFVTEVFGIVPPGRFTAGLIGNFLPNELRGLTMFLSRASEPARLQLAPITPTPPATARDCTL